MRFAIALMWSSLGLQACACGSALEPDAALLDASTSDAPLSQDAGGACDEVVRVLGDDPGICSFVLSYDVALDRIDRVASLGCAACCPFLSTNDARATVIAETGHDASGALITYASDVAYSLFYDAAPRQAVALIEPQYSGRVVLSALLPAAGSPGRLELPSVFAPNDWPTCPPARFLMTFDALDLSTGTRLPDGGRLPLEAFRTTPLAHHLARVFGHATAIAVRVDAAAGEQWFVIVEAGLTGD